MRPATLLSVLVFAAFAARGVPAADDLEFFESRIRPLLKEHCSECHSRQAGDPEGDLSFDSRADFLSAAGVAVAGDPDRSLIVQAVRYDGDLQMPPAGKLPPEAIRDLEEWVRRGLAWPDDGGRAAVAFDVAARKAAHWCWQPPQRSPPPAVRDAAWCRDELDHFVLARLEAAGLAPAPEAACSVLARRASAALTGLPPDPEAVAALVADPDPRAFEAYVDRLLASPHFGERFARHWLDVVRYAETRGHEFDYPIPNAYRYRDWVVQAFNDDLPYDQFVREQIAGDLVNPPRLDPQSGANRSVVGTGFWLLGEELHAPVDIAQDEADRIDNRVDTFGKAFLGLALGCARCHDHKFDAISAADYYAIAGMVMASSYRQAPFETLETNDRVARRLAAADAEARRTLLPLVAGLAGEDAAAIDTADAPADRPAADGETVIADYTQGSRSAPIIADGAAWGTAAVPAGQPVLIATAGGPSRLRLEPIGHAHSDAVWATTTSSGEREPTPLGDIDRAGRVLRTPKVRCDQGVIWHRVRGHLQIYVVVDSYVMLQGGPLYGSHLTTIDTKGEWQWVRQDLRKDMAWKTPHTVHVEYAAITGAADVAEAVAAVERPERTDPEGPARVNRALAADSFDWNSPAATTALQEAERLAAARGAIAAEVRLMSATAPALLDGNGIDPFVLLKGSAARRGDRVPRRFLEAVDGANQPPWPEHSSGRLQLADRVLDPANPLTARVIVNRIWHHLFGRGLVATTDNFGVLGEAPPDPQAQALLDTLAVRFTAEGWSIKRLVREIVTSSTWRMSSRRDPRAVEQDPLNLLLHHHPLRRLEAEAIRDAILAVSGGLDRTMGGPSVEVHLTDFQQGRGRPTPGPLDGAGRRSLYVKVRRNFLSGFLLAFDAPVPFQAMGRRNVTNVPAQSLALMNDPFVVDQAARWARQTVADSTRSPEQRIDRMFREAFARGPSAEELRAALAFLAAQAGQHGVTFAAEPRHEAVWTDFAHAVFNAKEFIFVP
jgi:hypothetical protein